MAKNKRLNLISVLQVLPVSMAQVYLLHFNLRFPTTASFEKVHAIFCVCLATLYPLTLTEIYYSVNSLYTDCIVSWEEFMQNFKVNFKRTCELFVK